MNEETANPSPRWGIVATIKEDEAQTEVFIAHHLAIGASEIHVYFDDPEDPSYAKVKDLPGVRATLCDDAHWKSERPDAHQFRQIANANAAYQASEVDWLAHVDGDELILCDAGVTAALSEIDGDAECIRMPSIEPFRMEGETEPRVFRSALPPDKKGQRIGAAAYGDEYRNTNGGLIGHLYGKAFARTGMAGGGFHLHVMTRYGKRVRRAETSNVLKLAHFVSWDEEKWRASLARRFATGSYRVEHSRATGEVSRKVVGRRLYELMEEGGEDACLGFLRHVQNFGPEKHKLRRAGAIHRHPLWLDAKVATYFPGSKTSPTKSFRQNPETGAFEAEVDFRGARLIVSPTGNFTEEMLAKGVEIEREELDAFAEIVSGKRVHFVDIGANAGIYSVLAARSAAEGSAFIAYEPNPVMIARLKRNLALNGLDHVAVREVALGAEEGEVEFYTRGNLGQSSTIKEGLRVQSVLKVRQETLPDVYRADLSAFDVSYIKIDIEGSEPQALGPLLNADDVALPTYIQYEHSHTRAWSIQPDALFGEAGYETHLRFKNNTIAKRAT
ncbi:MAG: FkbM family methyltransferase [Pseudomonadota bacterium]